MKYGGHMISWGTFFNLKLPITDEVREQARNWRECPTGERLFETLIGWGTTIPQCLTKKSRKMALKFTKCISRGNRDEAHQIYDSIMKEKRLLDKNMIWLRQLKITCV